MEIMATLTVPFVSSEDETPIVRARLKGLSSSLEANELGEGPF